MIVHLNGDYETVDYVPNRSVLLYDNNEDEEYPLHWHNAIEIIMPLTNGFEAVCAGKNYKLSERDILIIPGGTLHNLKAQSGRRIIFCATTIPWRQTPHCPSFILSFQSLCS